MAHHDNDNLHDIGCFSSMRWLFGIDSSCRVCEIKRLLLLYGISSLLERVRVTQGRQSGTAIPLGADQIKRAFLRATLSRSLRAFYVLGGLLCRVVHGNVWLGYEDELRLGDSGRLAS